MANQTRITEIKPQMGTAAERAAMSTDSLPLGSTFYETDTKITYIWDLTNWQLSPAISATMDDLTILGSLITTPSTAQVINAAGDAILANATLVELNPDGDYTLSSTPTIADSTEGQWLLVTVAAGEANTVTVQDQGTLASSNILLLNSIASRTIADGDTLLLRFNGTDWVEWGGLMEVDISTDTNLVAGTNITLSGDTLSVDDAFLKNDQADTISGTLTVGDGTNNLIFNPASGPDYNGTGRPTRYITLDATPTAYPDGADNSGTVTHQHDNTNHRNFWRWSSGSANQDIDLVFAFKLPADFDAWTATTAFFIDTRSNSFAGHVLTASLYDGSGSVDDGISGASIIPTGADDTWESKSDLPTASYSAGDQIHLHIHADIDTADDTLDIARVYFTYLASN